MKLETLAFVNESWPNTKVNNSVFCRKGRREGGGSVWAAEATVAGTTPHQQQHNGGRVKQKYFYRGGSELTAQWIQQLFRQRKLIVPLHRSTPINIVKSERKEKRCTKVKKMIKEVKTENMIWLWWHSTIYSHTQATGEKFICKSLEPIFCGNEQLNHISCRK